MKEQYRSLGVLMLLCVTAVPGACADELNVRHWQFGRPIRIVDLSKRLQALPLDPQVYEGSNADLSDLRLVDENGRETAYAVFTQDKAARRQALPVKVMKSEVDPEKTVLVADLGEKAGAYQEVTLRPKEPNFFRRIDLEGSDDLVRWSVIRKGIVVYSFAFEERSSYIQTLTHEVYSGYGYSRVTEKNLGFRFPEAKFRYLKVTVPHDKDKEPVELTGLDVAKVDQAEPHEARYQVKLVSRLPARDPKSETWTFDLGAKHIPVHSVTVETGQKDFFRRVRVECSNDQKEWETAGEGTLFSISADQADESNKKISFGTRRCRYLRLTVDNGDNRALPIASVFAEGLTEFVVFLPEAGKTYKLLYGDPKAKAVYYDTAQVIRGKELDVFGRAELSAETKTPDYQPEKGPWTEDKPYLLWAAMIAVIAGLFYLGSRVVQRPS